MMWENRPLTPAGGALRHVSGATDLTTHPGDWFSLAPRAAEERISLSWLDVIVAGQGLLDHVESFGAAPLATASLEIALLLKDRFGSVHNLAEKTLHTIEDAAEWRAGTHQGTVMDPHAGNLPQEASRAGLRGVDLLSGQPVPPSVAWTSPRIALRYGTEIERVVWEVDDLRDNAGNPLRAYEISFGVGQGAAPPTNWQPVSASASPGQTDWTFSTPLTGDYAQWKVDLKYSPLGVAYDETPRRTPVIYSLGCWLRLTSHQWRFESLTDLLARTDERARLLPRSWKGSADAVLLSLPLSVELRHEPVESIRARFVLQAGIASPLDTLQIRAGGSLEFEET